MSGPDLYPIMLCLVKMWDSNINFLTLMYKNLPWIQRYCCY